MLLLALNQMSYIWILEIVLRIVMLNKHYNTYMSTINRKSWKPDLCHSYPVPVCRKNTTDQPTWRKHNDHDRYGAASDDFGGAVGEGKPVHWKPWKMLSIQMIHIPYPILGGEKHILFHNQWIILEWFIWTSQTGTMVLRKSLKCHQDSVTLNL